MRYGRLFKFIILGIIFLFIINVFASFYFYNLAIKRGPKDFLQNNSDLEVSAEALDVFLDGDWRDWTQNQPFEEIEMTSFDGLTLKGYYLRAKEPTNKTVVFAHGYLGHAKDMGLYGEYYYEELGYNIFTPDLRGHGQSEGDYYGFGWHDRLDLIDWIDILRDKESTETEIVLHGLSMGAAAVLMVSGEQLPDNVKAIIADSPYTSVYDMFAYQMKRMFYLPDKPILPSTSLVTKLRSDYSLKEASALNQVKKSEVPILYIHGDADEFVPTHMTHQLYDQTAGERKIVTFSNAGHGEAFVLEKEKYKDVIKSFLLEQM